MNTSCLVQISRHQMNSPANILVKLFVNEYMAIWQNVANEHKVLPQVNENQSIN